MAHCRDVPKEKSNGKSTCDVKHPAIELLDGDCHHRGDEIFHPLSDIKGRGCEGWHVEVGSVAQDIVGHVVAQAPSIKGTTDDTADVHVHEIEH